ncbi:MAG: hypothetical protein AAGJ56_07940 [Myxococcota bacterium]
MRIRGTSTLPFVLWLLCSCEGKPSALDYRNSLVGLTNAHHPAAFVDIDEALRKSDLDTAEKALQMRDQLRQASRGRPEAFGDETELRSSAEKVVSSYESLLTSYRELLDQTRNGEPDAIKPVQERITHQQKMHADAYDAFGEALRSFDQKHETQ